MNTRVSGTAGKPGSSKHLESAKTSNLIVFEEPVRLKEPELMQRAIESSDSNMTTFHDVRKLLSSQP